MFGMMNSMVSLKEQHCSGVKWLEEHYGGSTVMEEKLAVAL